MVKAVVHDKDCALGNENGEEWRGGRRKTLERVAETTIIIAITGLSFHLGSQLTCDARTHGVNRRIERSAK